MRQAGISADNLTISDLLKDFYRVPEYQREYVWQTKGSSTKGEQVDQFLNDILSSMTESADKSYFIGSFVVGQDSPNHFEVIDGQQRLTTITVLLLAVKRTLERVFSGAESSVPKPLRDQIGDTVMSDDGEEFTQRRLEVLYKDGADLLSRFENDIDVPTKKKGGTKTAENLINAFTVTLEFLEENFKSPQDLKAFYTHFVKNVYVVRIVTPDVTKALQIFETLNNRGTSLNSMDLLKNLLFRETNPQDYDALTRDWSQMTEVLTVANEKPLRFLKYFVMGCYSNEPVREDALYDWFKKHPDSYLGDPRGFVQRLKKAAQDYVDYIKAKTRGGSIEEPSLKRIAVLTPGRRQHIILLLAAEKIPQYFEQLCIEIEATLFCHAVAREPSRVLEIKFTEWAMKLRLVRTKDEFDSFIQDNLIAERSSLYRQVRTGLKSFTGSKTMEKRAKYILARMADHLDQATVKNGINRHSRFWEYIDYELEHVLPKNPSEAALREFGHDADWNHYVPMLGNLTLLRGSENQSVQNLAFEAKKPAYLRAHMFLTQLLGGQPEGLGKDTMLSRIAARSPVATMWNPTAIEEREEFLIELALEVWNVPKPNLVEAVV